MAIEVVPATGRFDDLAVLVGPSRPDAGACWCMSYRDGRLGNLERREAMRAECEREPGPGVLAYVDGEVAGWCSVAPRSGYRRLMRSRTIPVVDDRDAWAIVCFVVRAPHRGRGVMRALLDGAIAHARANGGRVVEAYPVESGGGRLGSGAAYTGTTELFERAGFARVMPTAARSGNRPRWLMRLEL